MCCKTRDSYQGSALAMPDMTPFECPLRSRICWIVGTGFTEIFNQELGPHFRLCPRPPLGIERELFGQFHHLFADSGKYVSIRTMV